MFPIHILDLKLTLTREFGIDILVLALSVVPLHPEQHPDTQQQNCTAGRQIQAVTNMVIWSIERQKRPRGDEPANIAKHDVGADGGRTRSVGDDVRGDLRVAESAEREGTAGD